MAPDDMSLIKINAPEANRRINGWLGGAVKVDWPVLANGFVDPCISVPPGGHYR
jgi:hypothetical protein